MENRHFYLRPKADRSWSDPSCCCCWGGTSPSNLILGCDPLYSCVSEGGGGVTPYSWNHSVKLRWLVQVVWVRLLILFWGVARSVPSFEREGVTPYSEIFVWYFYLRRSRQVKARKVLFFFFLLLLLLGWPLSFHFPNVHSKGVWKEKSLSKNRCEKGKLFSIK